MNDEYNLTREDVLRLTGWSRATLYRRMHQGLRYKKVRGKTAPTSVFRKSDITDFIENYRANNFFEEISNLNTESFQNVNDDNLTEKKLIEDTIKDLYEEFRIEFADELLQKVKHCSPSFFESLVVEVLVKMGYGGTIEDAGKAVGKSGDGGIDGIIKEDRLGLDVIYLQAKRWEGNVSRPEIQKFAGALLGNQARKGVFITTSDFTKEAKDYVKTINSTIILINGEELAELMIDYNVGVSVATVYEIKKIDSDYFSEE